MKRLCVVVGFVLALSSVAAVSRATILYTEAFTSTEHYESPTSHSLGVAWLDFDGDGDQDLLATNGHGSGGAHLYQNNGGELVLADQYLPVLPDYEQVGVIYADYDNDGDQDVYIYTAHEDWFVGGLTDPPDGPPNHLLKNLYVESGNILVEPLFEDVAATAGVDDCPDTPFGDYPCFQTRTANWLDYDNDGCVDLYVGHHVVNQPGEEWNRDRLYRNLCDGTFEDATDSSGIADLPEHWRSALTSLAADFDRDGWVDLYIGNIAMHESIGEESYNDRLLRNQGDGTFREAFPGWFDDSPAAMGIDIADIDGNGKWDIYLTDIYQHEFIPHDTGNTLYMQTLQNFMTDNLAPNAGLTAGFSWGTNFLDADQDGDVDLFVGVSLFGGFDSDPPGHTYSEIFVNAGVKETFSHGGLATGLDTVDARGSAVADYDGDGDLDIAVVNQAGPLQVFRNDSTDLGNSLIIDLEATGSNPNCFGAVVTAEVGGVEQIRTVKGGVSAHSQDSSQIHFGLGSETAATRVVVMWPSGVEQELLDVMAGSIAVVEP